MKKELLSYKPVGILVHGCHLEATGWNKILFNDKDGRLGRVPIAIEEAIDKQARLIFWGTGASEKNGVKESEYTFNRALGSKLDSLASNVNKTPEDLDDYLRRVSYIDKKTQKQYVDLYVIMNRSSSHRL